MGRYNGDDFEELGIPKWKPIMPYKFPKSQVLFGFYENYNFIQKDKIMIIGESEKFVLQLRGMYRDVVTSDGEIIQEGYNYGLAVGKHAISPIQRRLIQSCFPDRIIIAFDEGISREYLIEEAKKLQFKNSFYKSDMKIGYIFDENNKYLPKGSLMSPSDLGKETFDNLIKECLYWVN
jgi:DNA primase